MLVVGSIVIRVHDLERQIRFWTAALDYVVREPREETFVVLKPRHGQGVQIALDLRESERVLPPRIHLDLYAHDQQGEITRLTALGARAISWDDRPEDADYYVLEDPEGNRFCIIDAEEWSGWAARTGQGG